MWYTESTEIQIQRLIFREKTRKAQAQLGLMLATVESRNRKDFFKYVNHKRK